MLESKAIIGETDMLETKQHDALRLAGNALDEFDSTDSTEIARFIKKEFDKLYGPGWQCIVGTNFGSFVTHHSGCFIYFCIGSLAILLFKGTAASEADTDRLITMEKSASMFYLVCLFFLPWYNCCVKGENMGEKM